MDSSVVFMAQGCKTLEIDTMNPDLDDKKDLKQKYYRSSKLQLAEVSNLHYFFAP